MALFNKPTVASAYDESKDSDANPVALSDFNNPFDSLTAPGTQFIAGFPGQSAGAGGPDSELGSLDLAATSEGALAASANKGATAASSSKKGGGTSSTPTPAPAPTPTPTPVPPSSTAVIVSLTRESPTLHPPVGQTTLPTDPYFSQEWNLSSSTVGINVLPAWQNYTGAGVKIGIVDDGVDYTNSDLSPNYLSSLQYNAVTPGSTAYNTGNHGTWVAGVLAAADNGSGVVGVAYQAGIAGFEIGYGSSGNSTQYANALSQLLTNGMDIANCSWGYSTPFQDNFSTYWSGSQTAILKDVEYGRGGLGMNIVFAAQNNAAAGDNVEYHNYQNDPYVITVGATDANGIVASFSDPGAALLVSAPGTYDLTDNTPGNYVAVEGTSFAAPTVSGVIALMLQANPNLGFLDIQEILAYSAIKTDPTNATWTTNGAANWNGGGLHFSQDYGFGLVDATAAVRLAESWPVQSTFADMSTETFTQSTAARYAGGGSVQSQITFNSSLITDKAVIDLNITDPNVTGLTVTLTSPDGTKATLVADPANGTGSGIVFDMSANNFMGENAQGVWTLGISDSVSGDSGTLNSWTLTTLGSAPTTAPDYIYTDEFATVSGASRQVLNDSSGDAGINTAAVTGACVLNLNPGAVDSIAGKSLTIGTGTVIKSLWAGDGNDTITCNNYGDTIQAGRGNDTIIAGLGADILNGGPGLDTFVFNNFKTVADTIGDFTVGSDVINLSGMFSSLGYSGSNPVADGWLQLVQNIAGGTNFVVNPHNGQASATELTVNNVAPGLFQLGTEYLAHG